MFNHAPAGYQCPMCQLVAGNNETSTKQEDIIFKNRSITAFIAAKWWIHNPGHVIIIPNKHFENLYDIPDEVLSKIYIFAKKVVIALKKVYKCDGTSTRQHNETSGNQDMWHFHLHVFPRYKNDELYLMYRKTRWTLPEERKPYIKKLKEYFTKYKLPV